VTSPISKDRAVTTETTRSLDQAGAAYRIQHPTLPVLLRDMRIPAADPGPGDSAPVIDLPTTTGGRLNTEDLARDGRPLFLVFGSLTCPITEGAADGIKDLHQRYADRIRFVLINVREAHPGRSVPQPQTIEEKTANAKALQRHHGFDFDIAVDDIDGTVHRSFGPRPSSAYIIDTSGTIVFRAQWSNVTPALEDAVAAVAADRPPPTPDVRRTLQSVVQMAGHGQVSFDTAGKGALRDTWKAAPPMAAMIQISRLFSVLPPHRRGGPAVATMLALGLLAVTVVAVILS
jgi:hypothetical protein